MKYSGQSTSTSMPQRQSPAQSSSWGSPQGHFSQNQVKKKYLQSDKNCEEMCQCVLLSNKSM